MAAALNKNAYKWKWDYSVRQIFSIAKPVDSVTNKIDPFTEAELKGYRGLAKSIKSDLQNEKSLKDATLKGRVNSLKSIFKVTDDLGEPENRPTKSLDQKVMLNGIFDEVNLPKDSDQGEPAKPKGRPQLPMPEQPAVALPIEPNDNIVLAPNAPTIYDAIKDADIRAINLETKSPAFNPEQTFSVSITPSGAGAITVNLTPIQYAALYGLKGVVRLLLKQKVDPTKRILTENKTVNKPILQAVKDYRKNDEDKSDIVYIFMIVNRAIQDATDDYSSGVPLDKKYGDGLAKDVDKALAKLIYDREYKELETPTQPLPTDVKTTSVKVEDAKKKGKEDAEKKEPRDSAYAVGSPTRTAQEIAGYNAEYTKVRVGKDGIVGKEDGEKGYPINPEYAAGSTTKTEEERKAYGEEYDKARAKYQGEKDALLNEESKFTILESQLSIAYTLGTANPEHKKTVKKLYDVAYEANRGKTADLVKEAGYVGAYPPNEAVLSGNFFGFGSELNTLVGFDTSGAKPLVDTSAKYNEGIHEFVKQIQSILGQAKYAGYMDGLKKNAKYTTPGRISVKGKEYAIDFGKLNTQLTTVPAVSAEGVFQETEESGYSERILTELRRMRDSSAQADSLQEMVKYLRNQIELTPNETIKQLLNPIVVSQKGGAILEEQVELLRQNIYTIKNDTQKDEFLAMLSRAYADNSETDFNRLTVETNQILVTQKKEDIRLLIDQLPNEKKQAFVDRVSILDNLNDLEKLEFDIINNQPIKTVVATDKITQENNIKKLKNVDVQTQLLDRLNDPTLTKKQYFEINRDRVKAYNRELGLLATIETLADPGTRQSLVDEYKTVTNEATLAALETNVKSELDRNPLAVKIQSLKDKKDFESRFREPSQNIDILKQFVDDQYALENPGIGTRLQTGLIQATNALGSVPTSIVTELGTVTTKSQLYDLVQKAFSSMPKYVPSTLKTIPKGVAPDDPSLGSDVHPTKRVQAMYDREFERGTKEGMRKGGTRRTSKTSKRFTKKQHFKR